MGKLRTSRHRARKPSRRMVRLDVRNPRIMWCQSRRYGKYLGQLLLALAVLVGGYLGGRVMLNQVFLENDEFVLRSPSDVVLVTNGQVSRDLVFSLTELDVGKNIFSLDLKHMQKALEALPEVKTAQITRRLPHTVRVELMEREPVAWLECTDLGYRAHDVHYGYLISAEGILFRCTPTNNELSESLPILSLPERYLNDAVSEQELTTREARQAFALLNSSRKVLGRGVDELAVVSVVNEHAIQASTQAGVTFTFGMYDHERQLKDLALIINHAQESERTLLMANLIPMRNIPVIFANEDEPVDSRPVKVRPKTRLERDMKEILERS